MKNERYLEQAVAALRRDKHLPDHILAHEDDDIVATTQSVFNVAQELASSKTETITLDFEDAELLKMMIAAHELDITFTEFVERALIAAIEAAEKP